MAFIENLRKNIENVQSSAASGSRGEKDTRGHDYFLSKLEYASEDDVKSASGLTTPFLKADRPEQKTTWNYTPIAWNLNDGKQKGFGYLITDDGSYGNKVFGLESADGKSLSPDGTRALINNIQNLGGSVKIGTSYEQMEKDHENPLRATTHYDTDGYGTFKTGETERGRQNRSDAMGLLKKFRASRGWE